MANWDPFDEMEALRRHIDRAFQEFAPAPQPGSRVVFSSGNDGEIRPKAFHRSERASGNGLRGAAIYREFELANYFRRFELSDKVDQTRISAELKHGVLTLKLPKTEEARPKKIAVKVN